MNNLPQVFNFENAALRVVIENGEPWFVAKDVCEVLDLGDVSKAVSRLDDDERGTNSIPTLGGNQEMLTVNETGLYSLVLGSRKPEAKSFKRWITHEVLPAIRKTGAYIAPTDVPIHLEDLIIMQAQSVKELKVKVDAIEITSEFAKDTAIDAHKRINALDTVDADGTLRQQLADKVNKYAKRNGILYATAWSEFRDGYNLAFHTNVRNLANHYARKNGIKKTSIPEYLESVGKLEDALRVMDKMLQPSRQFTLV